MIQLKQDESLDFLADEKLKIIQKKMGQKTTHDSLRLAEFSLRGNVRGRAVEFGVGNGTISILLAANPLIEKVVGIELQPELAELARRNVALNNLQNKIEVLQGDWREVKQTLKGEKFDLAIANPPYWKQGSGKISHREDYAHARHELTGGLEDLILASRYLLNSFKGGLNLIYPVWRLAEVINMMEKYKFQPKLLQLIYHDPQSEASLFMVRATLNGQPGLKVLPPVMVGAK